MVAKWNDKLYSGYSMHAKVNRTRKTPLFAPSVVYNRIDEAKNKRKNLHLITARQNYN